MEGGIAVTNPYQFDTAQEWLAQVTADTDLPLGLGETAVSGLAVGDAEVVGLAVGSTEIWP